MALRLFAFGRSALTESWGFTVARLPITPQKKIQTEATTRILTFP
jgi:hypothetical protein